MRQINIMGFGVMLNLFQQPLFYRRLRGKLAITIVALLCISISTLWFSCKNDMEGKQFLTSDDVMIDDYITQKDETASMTSFLEIVDKAGFRGMIHAYGAYTCFIPDNDAVSKYLNKLGFSSVSQLSVDACVELVKYHVVRDTLRTSEFVDGRLKTANMLAKYITTRSRMVDGHVFNEVNRQALITQKDIKAANGYIHKLDNVLIPPERTAGEQIMDNSLSEYSLFRSLMKKTGWIDSLNRKRDDKEWYTVFMQSNKSFIDSGIDGEETLIKRLKKAVGQDSVYMDSDSLLWTFCAYHCVKGLYYVADLSRISALQSLAPNQAITFILKKDSVLVNEYINVSAKIREKGIAINKKSEFTDYSCKNGVLLDLEGYIGPVKRPARAVFWDVCEQPEFIKDSRFRKGGYNFNPNDFTFEDIKFDIIGGVTATDFGYQYQAAYANNWALVNQDALQVNYYRLKSITFTLPLLTEGTYNVWYCIRRANTDACRIRGVFIQDGQEDQVMANMVTVYDGGLGSGDKDKVYTMLASGVKRFTAKKAGGGELKSLLLGVILVKSTGRHKLMIEVLDRGRNTSGWIDMIHFIPLDGNDENQLYPQFDMKGNAIYRDTPCNEIWPFDVSDCDRW